VKGFKLGEQIGFGGFGVVYRGLQTSVERDVAIKIILPRYANQPDFIRRFEAEAFLVAKLEHPHIVPLYDYWREPNAAYLIMRLLRGGDLGARLQLNGPLDLATFQQNAFQIGRALAEAHRHQIVHRDIKPANVLLDENGNAYLTDFGIAKNLDLGDTAQLTQDGALLGSPAYISPEQIKNEPNEPVSDIYCFGLLMFEMLTGQRAFNGPTPVAYLQQHLNETIPSILTVNPDLPPKLDGVLRRAGAKNPQERFPNMRELLAALQNCFAERAATVTTAGETGTPPLSPDAVSALDNPYRGLRPFSEADAELFYGRETFTQKLLDMLSDDSDLERFVAVVGPSGSGKSSVVRAGLLPALRRGGLPDSQNWFIVDFAPGGQPWEELEAALLRVTAVPHDDLRTRLQADREGLLRTVNGILPADEAIDLLLIIDQFEELFTLVADEQVRADFLEGLVTALLSPHSRLRVVLTMRADFIDKPLGYLDFGELLQQRMALLLPLSPDELARAITKPVESLGMALEPDLVATISREAGGEPGMLPLLQYALTELFAQREGALLTMAQYRQTDGVHGALTKRAE
jgi:serine/threonine protein kinase